MARTRGEANQSLYRARILLAAWERSLGEGRWPEAQLVAAFLPALRLHLRAAYGWFLLSVAGQDELREGDPPSSVAELPAPPPGRERAPELIEFERLEANGWVGDMLSREAPAAPPPGPSSELLGSDRRPPGFAVAAGWADALAGTMQRMDDSLSEC